MNFAKGFGLISTGSVRNINSELAFDSNEIDQGNVSDVDVLRGPFVKYANLASVIVGHSSGEKLKRKRRDKGKIQQQME